jgi:hypothetical protein
MLIGVNSCTKDSLVSNDNQTAIHKWNPTIVSPDEVYPFVLPEDMQPYQYAIYVDDLLVAFEHMQTVLDVAYQAGEWGYFMLSYNVADALVYYGFITSSSSYYNPDILNSNSNAPFVFIGDPNYPYIVVDNDGDDDDDNDDDGMCYLNVRTFSDKNKAVAWKDKKIPKGKEEELGFRVGMNVNKNGKTTWTVVIFRKP